MITLLLIYFVLVVGIIGVLYRQRRFRLQKPNSVNRHLDCLNRTESLASIPSLKEAGISEIDLKDMAIPIVSSPFGVTVIHAIDPENIQAILSKQFDDFCLGSDRKRAFGPLIGHRIFTTDGATWKASRKLIRAYFNQKEVPDVSMFEEHIQRFLHLVPRDDTPLDLHVRFSRFTIDVTTEFLFEQFTNNFMADEDLSRTASDTIFAASFDRAQRVIVHCFGLGPLAFLVPKTQFRKNSEKKD